MRGANGPLLESTAKELIQYALDGSDPVPFVEGKASSHQKISRPTTAGPKRSTEVDTFAFIKPDGMSATKLEGIMDLIRLNRFRIVEKKKVWLTAEMVGHIYVDHKTKFFFESLCNYMTSGPVICLILSKENAIEAWRTLIGPSSSIQARESDPQSIRAIYGTDSRVNAVFGADNSAHVSELKEYLFNADIPSLSIEPQLSSGIQKSLVLITPELFNTEKFDSLMDRLICKGFHVIKRDEVTLTADLVVELYPKLVDSTAFVEFLCSGQVMALNITGDCVISELLEMVGPDDLQECIQKYPSSIRAIFATDEIRRAIIVSQTAEEATHQLNVLFPHVLRTGTLSSKQNLDTPVKTGNLTLALLKPDAINGGKRDEIIAEIIKNGFKIEKQDEIAMNAALAKEFYKEHIGKDFFENLIAQMSR